MYLQNSNGAARIFSRKGGQMTYLYQHGLVVMRAQPLHIGHERIIKTMLEKCACVTIILGSIQEQGTPRNPFTYMQRKQMILNCFAKDTPRLKVMGLFDINNPVQWAEFVLDFLHENMPERGCPDVYFAGSPYDAQWFKNSFAHIECIDRTSPDFPYVSGSMVRDMITIGDSRWKNFVSPVNHHFVEEFMTPKKGEI